MIKVDRDACCLCGLCVGVCPPAALEMWEDNLEVLPKCTDCGWCVPYCPVGALSGERKPRIRLPETAEQTA